MSDTSRVIRAEGLKKYYTTEEGFFDRILGDRRHVKAVDGVDLEIKEGETLGLVGESGCGKSSLGRTLLQLEEPTEGNVYYDGQDLTQASTGDLRQMRKDLQMIFQNPFSSLNPRLTVSDIIGEALDIHSLPEGNQTRAERVRELLEIVGLSSGYASRYPHEFSGGQLQRIGIARALAVEPEFIVCDEPVSALDVSVQAQILNLLDDLQDEFGHSYLFIAHDLGVVEHIADRIAVMYLGKIVEIGTTEEIIEPPYHPYTEALFSAIPEPDPRWEGDQIILRGDVPSPIDPPIGCKFHTRCPKIIQPPEYDLDQTAWRSIMNFKQQVAQGGLDVEGLASARDMDVTATTDDELASIVRTVHDIPDELSDPDAEAVLSEAISDVLDGSFEVATERLEGSFSTVCREREPRLLDDDSHPISCHLYDSRFTNSAGESR